MEANAFLGGLGDLVESNVDAGNKIMENRHSAKPSTIPTMVPSFSPSFSPSNLPSVSLSPSAVPTSNPSLTPTSSPSFLPSSVPTLHPSLSPSTIPTATPSSSPSNKPSAQPSESPTDIPSLKPSVQPSVSSVPSVRPSTLPSLNPSAKPSSSPSGTPSLDPSTYPTLIPSYVPSIDPTLTPSEEVKTYAFATDIIIQVSNVSATMDDKKVDTFETTTYNHIVDKDCASSTNFDVTVTSVQVSKQEIVNSDTLSATLSINGTVTSRYSSNYFSAANNLKQCFTSDFNGRLHSAEIFPDLSSSSEEGPPRSRTIVTILASGAALLAVILSTFLGVYYNSLRRERLTVELPDASIFDNHKSFMSESFYPRSNASYSTRGFGYIGQANPITSSQGVSYSKSNSKGSIGQLELTTIGSQESFSSKRTPIPPVTDDHVNEVPTSIMIGGVSGENPVDADESGKASVGKNSVGLSHVYVDNMDDDDKSPTLITSLDADGISKDAYTKSTSAGMNSLKTLDYIAIESKSKTVTPSIDNRESIDETIAQLSPRRQEKDIESLMPEEIRSPTAHSSKKGTKSKKRLGSIFSSDLLVASDDENDGFLPSLAKSNKRPSHGYNDDNGIRTNPTMMDEKSNYERSSTPYSESSKSSYLFGLNISEDAMLEAQKVGRTDMNER